MNETLIFALRMVRMGRTVCINYARISFAHSVSHRSSLGRYAKMGIIRLVLLNHHCNGRYYDDRLCVSVWAAINTQIRSLLRAFRCGSICVFREKITISLNVQCSVHVKLRFSLFLCFLFFAFEINVCVWSLVVFVFVSSIFLLASCASSLFRLTILHLVCRDWDDGGTRPINNIFINLLLVPQSFVLRDFGDDIYAFHFVEQWTLPVFDTMTDSMRKVTVKSQNQHDKSQ